MKSPTLMALLFGIILFNANVRTQTLPRERMELTHERANQLLPTSLFWRLTTVLATPQLELSVIELPGHPSWIRRSWIDYLPPSSTELVDASDAWTWSTRVTWYAQQLGNACYVTHNDYWLHVDLNQPH